MEKKLQKKLGLDAKRRRGGLKAVGGDIGRVTRRMIGKKGFVETDIIARWSHIVGEELRQNVRPERIVFPKGSRANGTLHVRVKSGAFALELAHRKPAVIERVNAHFGYRAVADLSIHQGGVIDFESNTNLHQPEKHDRKLSEPEQKKLDDMAAKIENDSLKKALRNLGQSVYKSSP